MFESILLPLDGSAFSEAAVPVAVSLSRRTGATLRVVTVLELHPAPAPFFWEEAARDHAANYLEAVRTRIGEAAGGEVRTAVLTGHLPSVLQAEGRASDLVVMATHGRGGLSRAWMGSSADHLVRHAEHPVLLVRPDEGAETDIGREWTLSRMLLPLDGSDVSEAILDHAIELGSLFGSSYHLARVVPSPKQFSTPYPPHLIEENRERLAKEKNEATEYLKAFAEQLGSAGLAVDFKVLVGGQPAHDILVEAQSSGCDFIAISAHGRGSLARAVLGSTSDKVVRGTHLPVLVFRARG